MRSCFVTDVKGSDDRYAVLLQIKTLHQLSIDQKLHCCQGTIRSQSLSLKKGSASAGIWTIDNLNKKSFFVTINLAIS